MGVKEEDTDSAAPGPEDEEKQGGSKFAQHLSKQEGASAFSKSKTLREQRQYLPAFAVREDLLRVISRLDGTSAWTVRGSRGEESAPLRSTSCARAVSYLLVPQRTVAARSF